MGSLIRNGVSIAAMMTALSASAYHDPATFVRAIDKAQWSVLPDDQIRSLLKDKDEASELAPVSHPVTKRLQYWLDLVHDLLLKKHPEQLGNVPRPRAVVIAERESDAFVDFATACLEVPTRVIPANPPERDLYTSGDEPSVLMAGSYWGLSYGDYTSCNVTYGAEMAAPLISYLAKLEPRCTLKWDGREITVSGAACPATETQDTRPARRIAWDTTADTIFFYAGLLIASKGEQELAHTVAHELGHYYRNHMGRSDGHNYFYKLSPAGQARTPVASESNATHAAAAEELTGRLAYGFSLAGKLHPAIQKWVGQQLLPVLEAEPACKDRLAPIAARPGFNRLVRFAGKPAMGGTREIERAAEPLYLELEAAILEHCKNVEISPQAGESIRTWMPGADRLVWQGKLLDLIDALQKASVAYAEAQERFLDTVNAEQLGYYTQEEEADAIMIEVLSMLGFTRDSILTNELNWMFAWEAYRKEIRFAPATRYRSLPMAECKSLFEAGWPNGPIRLGQIDDGHHDLCFRFYMTTLELKAHDYQPGPVTPMLSAEEFKLLQSQARSLLRP